MTLQSDVIQAVAALGTAALTRVFDEQVPQGAALPFMALTVLSANQPQVLNGSGLLKRATIRLAIFSRSASERDVMGDVIRATYHGFKGTVGSTNVSSIRVEDSADSVELSDGDNIIKGKGLDLFTVYY